MEFSTKREIKLKNGTVIAVGASLKWENGIAHVSDGTTNIKLSALSAARAMEIPRPSMGELEHWVYDTVCPSVMGGEAEPDGYDEYGSPSWLLALGLI